MTKLFNEVYKLKNIIRKGWQIKDAKDLTTNRTESDAEHCFSLCLLALEIMEKEKLNLNKEKVLKMCLYHELGETKAGDITPYDNISKQEKFRKEFEAVEKISISTNMPEILTLWLEFENNQTPEAKFVKVMDKLDAVKQAKIYSKQQNRPEIFEEFYNNYLPIIKDFKKYI